MPSPESLHQQAQRLRQQADSLDRQAHDVQQHIQNQDQTIQTLERNRQEWQQKLHAIEIALSANNSESEQRNMSDQINDITRKLLDMDKQIQNARSEKDHLMH